MIPASDLRRLARARLRDAKVLFRGGRYDAAGYICGYAVELALKARIGRFAGWNAFPSTGGEFAGYQSLRTHDLEVLLRLSGRYSWVGAHYLREWTAVMNWDPIVRYELAGTANQTDVAEMIRSAHVLVRIL